MIATRCIRRFVDRGVVKNVKIVVDEPCYFGGGEAVVVGLPVPFPEVVGLDGHRGIAASIKEVADGAKLGHAEWRRWVVRVPWSWKDFAYALSFYPCRYQNLW